MYKRHPKVQACSLNMLLSCYDIPNILLEQICKHSGILTKKDTHTRWTIYNCQLCLNRIKNQQSFQYKSFNNTWELCMEHNIRKMSASKRCTKSINYNKYDQSYFHIVLHITFRKLCPLSFLEKRLLAAPLYLVYWHTLYF